MRKAGYALLIVFISWLSVGSDCEIPPELPGFEGEDEQPVETGGIIEIDHQSSFSPFYPWDIATGTSIVMAYFPPTGGDLQFQISSISLADEAISMNELGQILYSIMEKDDEGCNKYEHHLFGIKHLWGSFDGRDYRFTPGTTFRQVHGNCTDSLIFTIVCVEVCVDYNENWATLGATTHELGHNYGRLSHYCLDGNEYMINSAEHDPNDKSCIMGNSFEPLCGEPTLPNIHFCVQCMNKLGAVKW